MSEELSKILDNYISSQEGELFSDEADIELKEKYKSATKKRIENIIYSEIQNELEEKIIADAEKEIDKRAGMKRVKEYKSLTLIGIIMAFFVGLLTNQITDILGMWKGTVTVTPEKIKCTVIISFVIFMICVAIAFGLFISEIIKMLERNNDERDSSREDI